MQRFLRATRATLWKSQGKTETRELPSKGWARTLARNQQVRKEDCCLQRQKPRRRQAASTTMRRQKKSQKRSQTSSHHGARSLYSQDFLYTKTMVTWPKKNSGAVEKMPRRTRFSVNACLKMFNIITDFRYPLDCRVVISTGPHTLIFLALRQPMALLQGFLWISSPNLWVRLSTLGDVSSSCSSGMFDAECVSSGASDCV